MQDKQSVLFTRPTDRQQEARGKVVIHPHPSQHQKEFHSRLRSLRHFEEFLRIRPLQSQALKSTRPWGNLPPLGSLFCGPAFHEI